jgi:starch phosphorylase
MAHLAIVGGHTTNGVAAIHTRLLKTRVLSEFAELYPDRFDNKTNGVTPRRWLLQANPDLAGLITDAIGDGWVGRLDELRKLAPLADDAAFRERFRAAKRAAKLRFVDWIKSTTGKVVDPDTIFDAQVKRIHEYKRQLLNVLNIVALYQRIHEDPGLDLPPRTFFLAGKAAPSYRMAKVFIKLINCVAETVNQDPVARGKLAVHFLPDYSVTLAERLIPASDVSEQISTAGFEASGTSCMKFMMNGALTVATRDGANIEIAEEVGEENMFLFGLSAEQVEQLRPTYEPHRLYDHDVVTRRVLDAILSDHFNPGEPGLFQPLREMLFDRRDFYMNLADLGAYIRTQKAVSLLYRDQEAWSRKAVKNVAASGKFSSDRTIEEYARDIWHARPCPID